MNLGLRAILYTVRKWKKNAAGILPAFSNQHTGIIRSGDCRRTGGTDRGSPGNHQSQLHCSERHIHRRLVKRKRRFLQHTGIYDRGHDPGDCLSGRHPGI